MKNEVLIKKHIPSLLPLLNPLLNPPSLSPPIKSGVNSVQVNKKYY